MSEAADYLRQTAGMIRGLASSALDEGQPVAEVLGANPDLTATFLMTWHPDLAFELAFLFEDVADDLEAGGGSNCRIYDAVWRTAQAWRGDSWWPTTEPKSKLTVVE